MLSFTPDELDIFDHETYGAVDYVGMYNEKNTERLLEKRPQEYDGDIEDRKITKRLHEMNIEWEIERARDKQNAKNKKLRDMDKRLVNKDFKEDVEEYISRLNTILHSYRFATEKEYDEIIDFNAKKCSYKFTGDQVFVDSHYGGDDDDDDENLQVPRKHDIYLYNKENTLVALVTTYVYYEGEIIDNGWSFNPQESECFIKNLENIKAPTFLLEKISIWNDTLKDVEDIEAYLEYPDKLQFYVSPLRNPEYTWRRY